MLKLQWLVVLCLALGLSAAALAEDMSMPTPKPNAGFDAIKALAGNWDAQTPDGKPVKASYEVVSNGNCVIETLDPPDHGKMITMYRVDGGRLVMDHYCSMNNVPHMSGKPSADGKAIDFTFMSASNLASPKDTHMHGLKLTFDDKDHLTHEWSLHSQGKIQPVVFHFARSGS